MKKLLQIVLALSIVLNFGVSVAAPVDFGGAFDFSTVALAAGAELYEVTVSVNPPGFGTAYASTQFAQQGDTIYVEAYAVSDYEFEYWQVVSGGASLADGSSYATWFIMPDSDVAVTAYFSAVATLGYTVSYNVVGGGGTLMAMADNTYIGPGDSVLPGLDVEFTAAPNGDYRVIRWALNDNTISGNTTNNYILRGLSEPVHVTVEFEPIPIMTHKVVFNVLGDGGSLAAAIDNSAWGGGSSGGAGISRVVSGEEVPAGGYIIFTASASYGYRVKAWKLNGSLISGNVSDTYTISSISAPVEVTVEFELIVVSEYNVSFSVFGYHGSISATSGGGSIYDGFPVAKGASIVFTAHPDSGYRVKAWMLNGNTISGNTANSYTLTNLSSNAYVEVEFTQIEDPGGTLAASARSTMLEVQPFDYLFSYSAYPIKNYLAQNADKSLTAVNVDDGTVSVEICDAGGKIISTKEIKFELPIFGAFFSGEKYNYIAFGQDNPNEIDSREVIRIVKYDKKFNKLGSASVNGGASGAIKPFNSGAPRMAEQGSRLILHTSRLRYITSDGLNHQSNLTIVLDTDSMRVTHTSDTFPSYHVSHSFDQYVIFDGASPVFLDLGDAYPRSVLLQRAASADNLSTISKMTMRNIPGNTGNNYTGIMTGGLAMSSRNYIAVIAAAGNSNIDKWPEQRDIVTCVAPKAFTDGEARQTTIAKYIGSDIVASAPRLVSNGDGSFIALWQEFPIKTDPSYSDDYRYCAPGDYVAQKIDGDGKVVGVANRFVDVREFYKEFFKTTTLPSSVMAVVADGGEGDGADSGDGGDGGGSGADGGGIGDGGGSGSGSGGGSSGLASASDWARAEILSALGKGFVPLDIQGDYTNVITRIEFCRMAVKFVEYTTGKSIDAVMADKGVARDPGAFTDTDDPDIAAAFALGITNGTGIGIFTPYGSFDREQAARMLMNVCMVLGEDIGNPPASGFVDMGDASDWARQGIDYCYASGIMIGTGANRFSPKEMYTREQSILTFNRIKIK